MQIPVSKEGFNKAAIKLLNCFLDMSEYEITIIVGMLNNNITSLTTKTRAELVEKLSLKTMSFNNYIKRLKDKGTLMEKDKGLIINPNITMLINNGEVNITIKKIE